MAEYTLILQSEEDYRLIKKLLRAFDGASIRPTGKTNAEAGREEDEKENKKEIPFKSTKKVVDDLLD